MITRETAAVYAAWFRCLADATRVRILSLLAAADREMPVGEVVAALDVGQSTVSHHLKILRDTGFVHTRRQGTASYVRVNRACVDHFPTAAEVVMGRVAAAPQATAGPATAGVCPAPWAAAGPGEGEPRGQAARTAPASDAAPLAGPVPPGGRRRPDAGPPGRGGTVRADAWKGG